MDQASSLERKACRERENVRVALMLEIGLILFKMAYLKVKLGTFPEKSVILLWYSGCFAKLLVMSGCGISITPRIFP